MLEKSPQNRLYYLAKMAFCKTIGCMDLIPDNIHIIFAGNYAHIHNGVDQNSPEMLVVISVSAV